VRLDGRLSKEFTVERGVSHITCPITSSQFLLVMDPLLKQLQASGMGLPVNEFYAGRFLHMDDSRTLEIGEASLKAQVALVNEFANTNFLKLNLSKCKIVVFSRDQRVTLHTCDVDGSVLPVGDVWKRLGYWWEGDLLATGTVEENIKKAWRAFFHYGSIGVFQGDLNPMSCCSVLEMCVMPVLLYGGENWILTDGLMEKLEKFQAELAN